MHDQASVYRNDDPRSRAKKPASAAKNPTPTLASYLAGKKKPQVETLQPQQSDSSGKTICIDANML